MARIVTRMIVPRPDNRYGGLARRCAGALAIRSVIPASPCVGVLTYFIETPCAKKVSPQGAVASWSADRAGPQREEVDRDDTTDGREHGPARAVRAVRLG